MGFPDHSADRSWLCLRTTDRRARALVQGVDRGVGMALEHKHYSNGGGLVDRPVEYRVESNGSVKRASNVPLMSDAGLRLLLVRFCLTTLPVPPQEMVTLV